MAYRLRLTLLIFGILIQHTALLAWADSDPLKPIEREFANERPHKGELKELYSAAWLKPGTNFARIFVSTEGPRVLLDWLGAPDSEAHGRTRNVVKQVDLVLIQRRLRMPGKVDIYPTILVPHPKYLPSRELGLIPEFYRLEPPGLKVIENEARMIRQIPVNLYHHEGGGCSLVIKLNRGTAINMATKSCAQRRSLLTLAELLGLERLNSKLLS